MNFIDEIRTKVWRICPIALVWRMTLALMIDLWLYDWLLMFSVLLLALGPTGIIDGWCRGHHKKVERRKNEGNCSSKFVYERSKLWIWKFLDGFIIKNLATTICFDALDALSCVANSMRQNCVKYACATAIWCSLRPTFSLEFWRNSFEMANKTERMDQSIL